MHIMADHNKEKVSQQIKGQDGIFISNHAYRLRELPNWYNDKKVVSYPCMPPVVQNNQGSE